MYLKPGLTFMLQLNIIPDLLPRKIIPLAIFVSIEMLSNDTIPTGLSDKLYFPHNRISLNPNKLPILSSTAKLIIAPGLNISLILPKVVKFGLILNG